MKVIPIYIYNRLQYISKKELNYKEIIDYCQSFDWKKWEEMVMLHQLYLLYIYLTDTIQINLNNRKLKLCPVLVS